MLNLVLKHVDVICRSMEQDEAEAAATSAADIAAGVQPKKKRKEASAKQRGSRWSKFGKYSAFRVCC